MNFADPRGNVLQLALREGMKVADIGSGSGHYALAAASIVGSDGRVYAVDVQEEMLKHVKDAANARHLRNVTEVWGNAEKPGGTTLRDDSLDAAILSNTLFQAHAPVGLATEIKRVLKPGGKLLVIDWAGAYGGLGPDQKHVVSEHTAEELFIQGGFHKAKDFRAGPHHYGIIFTAP